MWVPNSCLLNGIRGLERPGLEVNYSYHLLPRLGISGATPLIPPIMPPWCTRGPFFFFPKIVKIYPLTNVERRSSLSSFRSNRLSHR